jgi:hypothetical protein
MTRGNAAWANKWQNGSRGSGWSRGGGTLKGRKDGRGGRHRKMRCDNQPVQMKRASPGWMTVMDTSNNNEDNNHNDPQ